MDKERKKDLTQGSVVKTMLLFAGPMIMGNMLQQLYNIAEIGRASCRVRVFQYV